MPKNAKKKILYISAFLCAVQTLVCILFSVYRIVFSANTPAATVTSALLFVLSLAGAVLTLCYTSKLTLRSFGILALHFGILFFFIGIAVYAVLGQKFNVSVPIDKTASYSEILVEKERDVYETVVLPFEMSLDSFEIVTYEDDGTDKEYNGVLTFTEKTSRRAESVGISVNKPVRKNGYKIYLMGFSGEGQERVVNMLLKRDPGEFISLAGMLLMIAGSFICAFCEEKKRQLILHGNENSPSAKDVKGGEEQ